MEIMLLSELNATGVYRKGGHDKIHVGTYGIVRDMTRRRVLNEKSSKPKT